MPRRSVSLQYFVKALRDALHLTQQELAVALNKTVTTVARWETSRPPKGKMLLELHDFALRGGLPEIATVFKDALAREKGVLEVYRTPEEKAWCWAIVDVLRNRGNEPVLHAWVELYYGLQKAIRVLLEQAEAGAAVQGDADDIRANLREIQFGGEGEALYRMNVMAEEIAAEKGISVPQAFDEVLRRRPELYEGYRTIHERFVMRKGLIGPPSSVAEARRLESEGMKPEEIAKKLGRDVREIRGWLGQPSEGADPENGA